jgi:regulator of nonsense transcripts 1
LRCAAVSTGDPVLQERFFEVLVLDEATQAPEPAALVAAAQRVQSVVMVGDPQQLPPTVRCQEAQRLGLGYSLFERVQAMGLKPLLLDTQYRMHPKVRMIGALLMSLL